MLIRSTIFTFVLCLCIFTPVDAVTIVEDFSYSAGELRGKGGVSGAWAGSWGQNLGAGTARIRVNAASNLAYSGGNYNIAQTGNGYAYGDYGNAFRGLNRQIATPLSGTVWFSVLIQNNDPDDYTGILLNHNDHASSIDYNQGSNVIVGLFNSTLQLEYSGLSPLTDTKNFASGSTHLLVGRIDFNSNGSNDTLSIWMDPADLANLTSITPNLFLNTWDIGTNLYEFGVFAYNKSMGEAANNHGYLDALRISDGNGDFNAAYFAVTGVNLVPEPGRAVLFAFATIILLVSRKRRLSQESVPV